MEALLYAALEAIRIHEYHLEALLKGTCKDVDASKLCLGTALKARHYLNINLQLPSKVLNQNPYSRKRSHDVLTGPRATEQRLLYDIYDAAKRHQAGTRNRGKARSKQNSLWTSACAEMLYCPQHGISARHEQNKHASRAPRSAQQHDNAQSVEVACRHLVTRDRSVDLTETDAPPISYQSRPLVSKPSSEVLDTGSLHNTGPARATADRRTAVAPDPAAVAAAQAELLDHSMNDAMISMVQAELAAAEARVAELRQQLAMLQATAQRTGGTAGHG